MRILLLLAALVYLHPLKAQLQSTQSSKGFIKRIEHGVYIDHRLILPYTHVNVSLRSNLTFEIGMLDLPTAINLYFNQTIQNAAGSYAWMINPMEEFAGYNGRPRNKEMFYLVGYSTQKGKYRSNIQCGVATTEAYTFKTSLYYRILNVSNTFVDLGIHFQTGDQRRYVFFGYSWGIE